MAKKNFYAVRQGRIPGIYNSWPECQNQITGYSNAEFKGFSTRKEAEDYMTRNSTIKPKPNNESATACIEPSENTSELIAYVDGSYLSGAFSYGCIIFDGKRVKEFKQAFYNHRDSSMHNVAGELYGARKAISYALSVQAGALDVYYDYQGIESWANGDWKTKKPGTIEYKKFVDEARKQLVIRYHKVKGHSGDKWNDRADALAKQALGIQS